MTQIVHLADIHIGVNNSTRTEEYAEVFSGLIIPQGAIVVIAGDIFHEKIELHPNDIDLFNMLLDKLTAGGNEVIIIPGNHDVNLQNNEDMDLILPLVTDKKPAREICEESWAEPKAHINRERVHYWRKSGVYELGGAKFMHVSLKCPLSTQEIIDLVPGHILLYHGMVEGTPFVKEPKITREVMRAADLCLFGDVHKFEFLSNTAAYAGSLIQQTTAESLVKGYIVWTFAECWRGEFIRAANEKYLVNITLTEGTAEEVERHRATLPAGQIVRLRVTTATPLSTEIENMITERIAPITTISYKPRAEEITYAVIVEQFTKMMGEANINADLIKKSIDDFMTNGIAHTYTRWYPVRMWWSNYFKYTVDNYMEFKEGIVSKIVAPNCSGKSSLIDILVVALFNHQLRADKTTIIKKGRNSAYLRIDFMAGGNLYTINRRDTLEHADNPEKRSVSTTVTLHGPSGNMTKENLTSTYKFIKQLIGGHKAFRQTCLVSKYATNIFDFGAKARMTNLMTVLGLDACNTLADEKTNRVHKITKLLAEMPAPQIKTVNITSLMQERDTAQQNVDTLSAKLQEIELEIKNLSGSIITQTAVKIQNELSQLYPGEIIDTTQDAAQLAQWTMSAPKNTGAEPLECTPADLIKWMSELSKMTKVASRGVYKCDSSMSVEEALRVPAALETTAPDVCVGPNFDVNQYVKYRYGGVDPKQGNLPELFMMAMPIIPVTSTPKHDRATLELEIELTKQDIDHSREITMLVAELARAKTASGFKFNVECSCCIDNNKYAGSRLGEIAEELTKLQAAQQQYVQYRALVDELHSLNILEFQAALEYEIAVTNKYNEYLKQNAKFIAWERYKEACGVINVYAEKYTERELQVARAGAYAFSQLRSLEAKIIAAKNHNGIVSLHDKLTKKLPLAIVSDAAKNKLAALDAEKIQLESLIRQEYIKIHSLSRDIDRANDDNAALEKYTKDTEQYKTEVDTLTAYIGVLRSSKFRVAIIEKHIEYVMVYTNSILKDIADFTVSMMLVGDEARAIIHERGKSPEVIEMGSGYQQSVAEFAFKLALSEIYPHSGQFFIIDEGFSTLDTTHTLQLADCIRTVAASYKNILIITHNKEIARAAEYKVPLEFNDNDCHIREPRDASAEAIAVDLAAVVVPAADTPPKVDKANDPSKYHCPCGAHINNVPRSIADHNKTPTHIGKMAAKLNQDTQPK